MIRVVLSFLCLNRLTKHENAGAYSWLTSLKFIRKNIVKLPFERGLTIRGVSYAVNRSISPDAFIRALKLTSNGLDESHFFVCMTNALKAEEGLRIGDLENGVTDPKLTSLPLYCFAYPWEALTMPDRARLYPTLVHQNRKNYMEAIAANIYDVSHLQSHFAQFSSLFNSIRQHGLYKTQTPPKVYILKKGRRWKWIMSGDGNHRVYCAHLLGHESVDVSIEGVIDEDSLSKVATSNGHDYSTEDLSNLFKTLWEGSSCVRGVV